ncbi:MAG: hypothetical protein MJK14_19395 [Rivularia sp. ALOHA_DT_140]|nr:hypothetical protein [Rivularia sp. ALOHA_DT_140]
MNKNNLKYKSIKNDNSSNTDDNNNGFILGAISVLLLILCISTLLLFENKQVRQIITKNINTDKANNLNHPKNTTILLTQKTLDIQTKHPNGTVGRLKNISFNKKNTIIEIAINNSFDHAIHINLYGKGIILVDDLGNKYNLKPPINNPYLEIKSNTTFKGQLVFQGGITAQANNLTLITNNQIGSDQPLTRRPKMEFNIPISQQDKLADKQEDKKTNKQGDND